MRAIVDGPARLLACVAHHKESDTLMIGRRRTVLFDIPSDSDQFSGGGHARTARALANTLEQLQVRSATIGIEGPWGSGKSTVVQLAAAELDRRATGRFRFFNYDLWANQSTGFRATFTESLLIWMQEQDETLKPFCRELADNVSARKVRTHTSNRKLFSGFGLVALLSLPLLPIVYSGLALSQLRAADPSPLHIFSSMAILATVLSAGAIHVKRAYADAPEDVRGFSRRLTYALSSAIRLFDKDAASTDVEQKINEHDSTQHGFRKLLANISSEFQNDDRRLVVVLDNVDRLPPSRIPAAWADIHSITVDSFESRSPSTGNLLIVIPYDRGHVLSAMHGSRGSGSHQEQADLLRKTFDVSFVVSAPVLSDASEFFSCQLRKALPEGTNALACDQVYRIFAAADHDQAQTPRRIISFINDLTSIIDQWWEEIPLQTAALFVATRHKPGLLETMHGRPEGLEPALVKLADDEHLQEHLAALWFNVPVAHATQILLPDLILAALSAPGDDAQRLLELSSRSGFSHHLEMTVRALGLRPIRASDFSSIASRISRLDAGDRDVQASLALLVKFIPSVSDVDAGHPSTLQGTFDLLRICSREQATSLGHGLAALVSEAGVNSRNIGFGQGYAWAEFINALLDRVSEAFDADLAKAVLAGIRLPSNADMFAGIACSTRGTLLLDNLVRMRPKPEGSRLEMALLKVADYSIGDLGLAWDVLSTQLEADAAARIFEKGTHRVLNDIEAEATLPLHRSLFVLNNLFENTDRGEQARSARTQLCSHHLLFSAWSKLDPASEEFRLLTTEYLWMLIDPLDDAAMPAASANTGAASLEFLKLLKSSRTRLIKLLDGQDIPSTILDDLVSMAESMERIELWRKAIATDSTLQAAGLLRSVVAHFDQSRTD